MKKEYLYITAIGFLIWYSWKCKQANRSFENGAQLEINPNIMGKMETLI